MTPEIAVVIPTYRRPGLLPRVVEALEKQTLDPSRFEVLIVDNGSNDETSAVLEELRDRATITVRPLVIVENRGPAGARNLGWQTADTPFIAFTDDDCVPDPRWLEWGVRQLSADDRVGLVQGRTLKPDDRDYPYSEWTSYREVLTLGPWFEGCNLFFRREALQATGGFDESILFGGEDTVAGWSVIEQGWSALYDQDAIVRHDLTERGVRWHALMGWREGNLLDVARRFPSFRRQGFWRPWAVRPLNVAFALGVAGTLASPWRRSALALWLPWLQMRRPPFGHPGSIKLLSERFIVDAATFAGMKVAAVRYRQLVL